MTRAFRSSSADQSRNTSNNNSNNNSPSRRTRSISYTNSSSSRSPRSANRKAIIMIERERKINEANTLCKTLALQDSVEDEDALECPICFLNYLQINNVTCCEGSMCTMCYMEIVKSSLPSLEKTNDENNNTTRTCPFCNVENFGIKIQGELLSKEKREDMLNKSAEKRKSAPEKEVFYTPKSTVEDRMELQREISEKMGLDEESRNSLSSYQHHRQRSYSSSSRQSSYSRNSYDSNHRRRSSRNSHSSGSGDEDEDELGVDVSNLTEEQQGLRQQLQRLVSGQASMEQIEDFFMMQAIRESMTASNSNPIPASTSETQATDAIDIVGTNTNSNEGENANNVGSMEGGEVGEVGGGGDTRSRIDVLQGMNPELLSIEEQMELAIAMSLQESEQVEIQEEEKNNGINVDNDEDSGGHEEINTETKVVETEIDKTEIQKNSKIMIDDENQLSNNNHSNDNINTRKENTRVSASVAAPIPISVSGLTSSAIDSVKHESIPILPVPAPIAMNNDDIVSKQSSSSSSSSISSSLGSFTSPIELNSEDSASSSCPHVDTDVKDDKLSTGLSLPTPPSIEVVSKVEEEVERKIEEPMPQLKSEVNAGNTSETTSDITSENRNDVVVEQIQEQESVVQEGINRVEEVAEDVIDDNEKDHEIDEEKNERESPNPSTAPMSSSSPPAASTP